MPNEEWRDIIGYEGYYSISNMGRIKGLNRQVNNNGGIKYIKERISKITIKPNGYASIHLNSYRYFKNKYIHRLVAEAFIENDNSLLEINHKNEIKTDNRVSNLEYCTRAYNMNYGSRKEACNKQVHKYDFEGNYIESYASGVEASKPNNTSTSSISSCCNMSRIFIKNFTYRLFKEDKIIIKKRLFKKILMYDSEMKFIREFDSAIEASLYLGCKPNTIVCNCIGRTKSSSGYIFKYKLDTKLNNNIN